MDTCLPAHLISPAQSQNLLELPGKLIVCLKRIGRYFHFLSILALLSIVLMPQIAWSLTRVNPPTDERDLVVFIANYKTNLYRLVGKSPIPFGNASFYNPVSLIADPEAKCFYVLDRPKLKTENTKIWRISADGTASIAFQGPSASQGGPFSDPRSLGLDHGGQILVADSVTGLWRLDKKGFLQCLFDGKDKPLYKITAAAGTPTSRMIIGTSYMYEITGGQMLNMPHERFRLETWSPSPSHSNEALDFFVPVKPFESDTDPTGVGNSTGRQVPIRIWKNQGGVFSFDMAGHTPKVTGMILNREPGGAEHDTFWRTLSQILVDASGRILCVDSGSKKTFRSKSYNTSHDYVSESVINGGVFVLHPDNALEELTYKTPDHNSGPMRRPTGADQWSTDTYIIADPELYIQGIKGTGGLLLLNIDGSRQAKWPFGERLRPNGVAVLRAAGPKAQVQATRSLTLRELIGLHRAGSIARIDKVSLEKHSGGSSSGVFTGLGKSWQEQPAAQAEAYLRSIFEGASWSIRDDGALQFSARGMDPQMEGNPFVMQGKVTINDQFSNAAARYKGKNIYDTQMGSLDANIHGTASGTVTAEINVTVFTKDERLKATFVQTFK